MRRQALLSAWAPLVASIFGLGATAAVVAALGMPTSMTLSLGWRAGLAVLASGAVGALLLRLLSRSSVAIQVIVVALTAVAAVGATYATTLSMYATSHDLKLLLVVLTGAAAVGVVTALFLGRRLVAASQALGDVTRVIGDGFVPGEPATPMAGELASLASELTEMAERLDAARAREAALEWSRRELVAWVSHDLRTPLAGLRAIAEALADGVVEDPAVVRRYHRTLRREAERLADLVDDLFELSRIQAGALRLEMEHASIPDLVSDAIAAADPVATAKGVHLEGRVDQPVPELDLSTPKVARVLRNLLENAIRHTPSDGTVWVATGRDGDEAYVSVTDACGGIPNEDLNRVFDLAFRGEAARTPGDDGGAGLGLAIAKGLVEAHRGAIAVSNADTGCRFTVRLPLPLSDEQPLGSS